MSRNIFRATVTVFATLLALALSVVAACSS